MFKIETHLHTIPASACGRFEPEEMVRFYKEAGYSTIFISDHFAPHHYSKLGEGLSWNDYVELLYNSYLRARKLGEELGMNVLFSPELTLAGNHYLLYNVTLEFLKSRDDFFKMTLEEFCSVARKSGIVIFQAHPLRDRKCFPTLELMDGVELINTNPRHENYDDEVLELIKGKNLMVSAGSDAHRTEDIALAAVLSPTPITTTEEYLELLRSGKAKFMKHGEIL